MCWCRIQHQLHQSQRVGQAYLAGKSMTVDVTKFVSSCVPDKGTVLILDYTEYLRGLL